MLPIIYLKSFTIHTNMSEDEAINVIQKNTYQTKVTGFLPISRKAKQKPFYGNVKYNSFKVYITSNLSSYLYMGIKGKVEAKADVTDIEVHTRGSSVFALLSQIIGVIFISFIVFILAMASTTPEQIILFLGIPCVIVIGLIVSSYLSALKYIKKAKQIMFDLFDQSD